MLGSPKSYSIANMYRYSAPVLCRLSYSEKSQRVTEQYVHPEVAGQIQEELISADLFNNLTDD